MTDMTNLTNTTNVTDATDAADIPDPGPAEAGETLPEPVRRPWYVSAVLALVAVTLMLTLAWGVARLKSPYPFFGTVYNVPATAFSGTDQDGQAFTFTPGQTRGATALFFGFTHCPNICPLSLAYLAKVRDALPADQRDRFKIILVSVDPERDPPPRLKEYVTFFGKATGVNIPEPRLSEVAKAYGVGYQKADIKSKAVYQINHTTATYLIDQSGRLRVLWDYTQLADTNRILADLTYVLEHPAP